MAFAEVPDDPAPSPVDNPTTCNQFWATTGPGAYGHQATPHLDPTSLRDLQRANLRFKWDEKGETVHHYLLKWRRWERYRGRALGEETRIVEILASIPPKIADPIEDRHLSRCLSNKEVKEEVEWEARNKTNVDLFRNTYKSTVVPAHCTASQLSGIFEDFCYWGKRVRGGVTLEDASKDWLDALRLQSDLIRKDIAEQTKCGGSFDYVRLYLFVQVYFLQHEKTDEHLAHLRRRHQGFKVNQLQEGPHVEGYSTSPAGVHNLLQDPGYPPPAQEESDSPPASPDEELEINIFGQKVTCSFCGFKGHKVETCYRKHPHLRPPAGVKRRGLKEGPPCKGCGSTWHTPDQCWKLHPHLKPQPKKAAKPPRKQN